MTFWKFEKELELREGCPLMEMCRTARSGGYDVGYSQNISFANAECTNATFGQGSAIRVCLRVECSEQCLEIRRVSRKRGALACASMCMRTCAIS